MPGKINTLRDHIYDAVLAAMATYTIPDFSLEKKWVPYETLQEMIDVKPNGKFVIVGGEFDDERKTRGNTRELEIPIMMGFQRGGVSPSNDTLISQLIDLKEEIRNTVADVDPDGFGYLRSESMKDENGLPFSLRTLRGSTVFDAIWTSYFRSYIDE